MFARVELEEPGFEVAYGGWVVQKVVPCHSQHSAIC